jgi:FkbM family methyltransferase
MIPIIYRGGATQTEWCSRLPGVRGAAFFYQHFPRLSFLARRLERTNYEPEMELLDLLCHRRKTSVDIGAKFGMYTYRILAHSGGVVAFEPIPHINRMLRTVFGRRCRVEAVALSSTPGEAVLRMPFASNGSAKLGRSTIERDNPLDHQEIASTRELVVETRTLDSYELEDVGFIKIDVEGHELSVLDGAVETIEKSRPNLLIEANDEHNDGAVARLAVWLRERDYHGVFVSGDRLRAMDELDPESHPGIENFIGIHRSHGETREQLAARVSGS